MLGLGVSVRVGYAFDENRAAYKVRMLMKSEQWLWDQ